MGARSSNRRLFTLPVGKQACKMDAVDVLISAGCCCASDVPLLRPLRAVDSTRSTAQHLQTVSRKEMKQTST